jgi:outer membrane biosynthesis protein TonB
VAEPAAPVTEPTLLQKFDKEQEAKKPEPAKSAEPAKVEVKAVEKPIEAKPADGKPVEAVKPEVPAAPEPVAYEYTLPDTIKMDDGLKTTFHTALDALRTDPAKGAQGLIDLHNQTMEQYAKSVTDNQMKVWNDTRRGWVTDVMADEQLGGAGYQTTMGAVARMRDLLVPESRRPAFEQMLAVTGVGDHPEFLRILHNAARLYDEAPMPPPNVRPPADIGKPPGRGGLRGLYKTNGSRQ